VDHFVLHLVHLVREDNIFSTFCNTDKFY